MQTQFEVQESPKVILIIGVPHPGKKAIADILCKETGYANISLDDLLTKEALTNSKIKEQLEKNIAIDDYDIAKILIERISKKDCKKGFILFDYPNTLKEAFSLYCIFSDLSIKLKAVIELKVSHKSLEDTIPKDDELATKIIEKIKYCNIESSYLIDYYTNKGVYKAFDFSDNFEKILEIV